MNAALFSALAFLGGVFIAVQAPTNAFLARASGSAIAAALISFAVGTAALAALLLATGWVRITPALRELPWYAWLGGLYGAFFVAIAALVAPRIGVGALLTAAVAGQLLAALLLDHYGLLGLPKQPANLVRMLGLAMVFTGAVLVRRG
jgi:bacterial/archaeal transporter family-2 protein